MNTFTDLKRLLRNAQIKYEIFDEHTLTVEFKSDAPQMGWGYRFVVNVRVGTDNYCMFASMAKQIIKYADYRKQKFEVDAYCFNCQELIEKMHRFGFLPNNAMAKIKKVVEKDGYGYVRKASKNRKTKGKVKPLPVDPIPKAA